MDAERQRAWIAARECFLDIASLAPQDQAARLATLAASNPELCAAVRRLLEQDPGEEKSVEPTALTFGPYRSIRLIAVGGMGEVHLARRTDGEFEREVAIKCLRPGREGEQLVKRFLRERQLLAQLDHEYITRLLDGGTTDHGHPYLVLEYVEGRHIDIHCRALDLDVSERITLFLKVLLAVQHAHEKGIVHRDLKPSNILVRPDGSPRLLDFGISLGSEATDPQTHNLTGTGQRLFTPEYASPEQIRGETATTASDVFSLGVVLYGLLAEVGPWDGSGSLHELERRVLEQEPASPGDLAKGAGRRRISSDLSTIILACLEKDPKRRLPSVQALADELQRSLDGFSIRTRPTRAPTRVLRYAKRNPWQALAAITLVLALISGGVAWQFYETTNDQSALLLQDLEQRLEFSTSLGLQDNYQDAIPELLAVRARLVGTEGLDALEARVASDLAISYLRTGDPRAALAEVDLGLEHIEQASGDANPAFMALLLSGATACHWIQETDRAREFAERAHEFAQSQLEPGHPQRIEAYQAVAGMTGDEWTTVERLEVLAAGLAEAREYGEKRGSPLADILLFHGILLTESGSYAKAVESLDEALAIRRWNFGERHAEVALVLASRGNCFRKLERWDSARVDLESAVATFEEGGHDQYLAPTLQHLGMVRHALGKFELALDDFALAKILYSEQYGAKTPICSYLEAQKAQCLVGMEIYDDARSSFEQAFSAVPGLNFQGPVIESELRLAFGDLLLKLNDESTARTQFAIAHQLRSKEFGASDPRTVELANRLDALNR